MNGSTDTNTAVNYLIVLYPSTCSVVTIDHHTPIYNLTHTDFTSLLKLNRQPFCFAVNVKVKEHDYQLGLFDTAGQVRQLGVGTRPGKAARVGGGDSFLVSKGHISHHDSTRRIPGYFHFLTKILNYIYIMIFKVQIFNITKFCFFRKTGKGS